MSPPAAATGPQSHSPLTGRRRSTSAIVDGNHSQHPPSSSPGCDACNNTLPPGEGATSSNGTTVMDLHRVPYTQDDFDKTYQFAQPRKQGICQRLTASCACSGEKFIKNVKRRLPILNWMPTYKVRQDLLSDVVAGITLAIVQIPQAMAFTMLSSASPVMGIYATFFSSLVYVFLGTSKFSSLGMAGVTALVVGKAINDQLDKAHVVERSAIFPITTTTIPGMHNATSSPMMTPEIDVERLKAEVATTMAFVVGVLQVLMGLLNLGSLSVFFSDLMMRACQMAAVLQMIISQFPHLLGVKIQRSSGPLASVYNIVDICAKIPETNVATLVVSIISILFLVLINEFINAKFRHRMKVPVPTEIILIAVSTAISYFASFNTQFGVFVLSHIPTGFPQPAIPRFDLVPSVLGDSVVVTVLTFTIIMSQAKVLSSKYECYPDISQELFANGVANLLGSFFMSMPASFAFVRCMLLIQLGARSMLCSIVCAVTLLLVLLFMGPLFEPLPHCVLAAIILVALAEILLDLKLIKTTWKSVKTDSLLIVASFLAVFLLDLQYGIAIGVALSMVMVIFKTLRPRVVCLGQISDTDLYLDIKKYKMARELPHIKIYQLGGPLFFGTRDILKKKVDKQVVRPIVNDIKQKEMKLKNEDKLSIRQPKTEEDLVAVTVTKKVIAQVVIIDCSSITFIDTSGMRILDVMIAELQKLNCLMYLAATNANVKRTIEKSEFNSKLKGLFYPLVHDAVLAAQLDLGVVDRSSNETEQHVAYDNRGFIKQP